MLYQSLVFCLFSLCSLLLNLSCYGRLAESDHTPQLPGGRICHIQYPDGLVIDQTSIRSMPVMGIQLFFIEKGSSGDR